MKNRQQAKDIPAALVLRLAAELRKEIDDDLGVWSPHRAKSIHPLDLFRATRIKTLPQRVAACGFDGKLALYKVERLCDQNFLDYGTSCNFAWPTEKGLKYLQENAS